MHKLMKTPAMLITLSLLLFLAVNVLGERLLRPVLIDLTDGGLYTLSDGTRDLVVDLEDPITLDFYFSRQLAAPYPQLLSYGKRIEDMLSAIARVAPSQVTVRVIDPEPFSEQEDEAVAAGLSGVPLGDGSTLYMGLTAQNTLDGEGAIPFFASERETFLEYDLAKLIQSLSAPARPKLALITQYPMAFGPGGPQAAFQGRSQPYVIYEQLSDFFDLQELTADFREIPDGTDIVMLVHPHPLSDDQLFLIDQFALSGGRVIALLDPHAESLRPNSPQPSASSLGPLLEAWGVTMPQGQVLGDLELAQRVQFGGYGPDAVKDYVFWLGLRPPYLSEGDITTGALKSLILASSGVLNLVADTEITVTPLLTSSETGMLFDAGRVVGVPDPDSLIRELDPTGETYLLAARLTGRAKSAYPDKVAAIEPPQQVYSEGDIRVVVIADSDFIADRFWVQTQDLFGERLAVPIADNGNFLLNLADHIAGSDALLGLRGRGVSRRPFDRVDTLRKEAEGRYLAEEQRLTDELAATEARLAELEQAGSETLALTPQQEAEVSRFREAVLTTRKALREVKRSLRQDIDALGTRLAAINILAVPLLVVLIGFVRVLRRRQALKRAHQGASS